MLDSKTLIYTRGEFSRSIWKFDPSVFDELNLTDVDLDDLHDTLIAYYQWIWIADEKLIKDFRHKLVDLIWEFANDELQFNEDWLNLAKCTEEDLIWNVCSSFAYCIEINKEINHL
jgi:hypothetical protein